MMLDTAWVDRPEARAKSSARPICLRAHSCKTLTHCDCAIVRICTDDSIGMGGA